MKTLPLSATVIFNLAVSGKEIVGICIPVGAAGTLSQLNLPLALSIPFCVSELPRALFKQ